MSFRLACVQTTSGNDMAANLAAATAAGRAARAAGADLVAFPEVVAMMEPDRALVPAKAAPFDDHPALRAFQALAAETGAWIVAGTIAVRHGDGTVANRSCLLDAVGRLVAWYDKIHMFDVALAGGESYRESATYRPGDRAVVAATPWGLLGLTVCYDLRFPHLSRDLAKAGALFLSVPSAFTVPTGAAHWEVLLRARAIECGAYVFAPAQCGTHAGGRRTWGHSLIVDPWGEILADGGERPGFVIADIDPAKAAEARRAIPALAHDRPYSQPAAEPAPRRAVGG
ncbi:MAG: carbon-nitrogen hydrolase family protein [Alphaproteobacteria bacterium]|nr:carbon-nitrogen hydrolase family protein [Alphaproteobacteria bacterium]